MEQVGCTASRLDPSLHTHRRRTERAHVIANHTADERLMYETHKELLPLNKKTNGPIKNRPSLEQTLLPSVAVWHCHKTPRKRSHCRSKCCPQATSVLTETARLQKARAHWVLRPNGAAPPWLQQAQGAPQGPDSWGGACSHSPSLAGGRQEARLGLPLCPQASHGRAPEAGSLRNIHCTGPRAGSIIA